jgi:predicted PhzF superfamily epimerase YddE/YHI9
MSAQQVSHRGGDLRVRVEPKRERVLVGGQAVTVLVGKLA